MRLLLLLIFAPRFLRDMPPRQAGRFIAEASTASPWYRWTRFRRVVSCRRRAYFVARWEALKLDWRTHTVAVLWSVRAVRPDDDEPAPI